MIPNKQQSFFSSPYFSLIKMPQLSVYVFICFNILAMGLYAGGTYFDITQPSYSITNNFFSDLGRWISYSGRLNVVSFVLFNSCVIFAGLVFTLFYINFQSLFIKDKLNNILAKLGTAFGVLGSLCLIGVGLTPADLLHNSHDFCATWTFRLFFPCTLFYAVALFRSVHLKSSMAYAYLSWSMLVITYVLVSELGPSATSSTGALIFQVVAQKLIVLTYVLNVFFQTYHIKKMFVDIKISLNTTPSSLSETFLNQLKLYSEKIIFTKSKQ
jgi:hypothetical membrane protein